MDSNVLSLAMGTGPVVQIVLLLLVGASVFSWTIIFSKWVIFKQARKESETFLDLFWNSKSLESIFAESKHFGSSPVANVFRAGYLEFQKISHKGQEANTSMATLMGSGIENVQRTLRKASVSESLRLERLLSYLATIASVTPFIGLFGTVWGIMSSFHGLASGGAATIQRVAPGISEALIATAVGLGAAIPAVIAYNQYSSRLRLFRAEMDNFASDFTNILKRNYLG